MTPASRTDPQLQKLEIKRGAFGLGAFAVRKIRKDEFIGGNVFPFALHPCVFPFVHV